MGIPKTFWRKLTEREPASPRYISRSRKPVTSVIALYLRCINGSEAFLEDGR
ncbi:hypothetical protein HYPSUDRAFT_48693 [Hypholoma sublateritium FD-334 SS-4]|uniref:Uncharacterized protein n=1 Tax=Hypholoma sublateritium (strain FD-334 SS-4) TaxID=945553 RepID=A0A0D2NEG4_HYPSF|nr:hypothetical protein HYPSUDRAFT_49945 [Hypholoma sublateritium FD-334 SS-4]KJA15071.1 hypothetical protein HYPSUDRAFT_48693 [Hypholoma sublateritium FD-334 SS-4]